MAKGYDGVKKTPRPRALEWAIATVVLLVAAGAGVAVAVTRHGSYTAAPSHTTPASPTKPAERPPLTLSFVSPQASAMDVAFRPAIRLTFNSPIAQDSALPIVTPTLPGNWARPDPETLVFQPSAEFFPLERVTVEVPGGPAGLEATNGEHLAVQRRVALHCRRRAGAAPPTAPRRAQLLAGRLSAVVGSRDAQPRRLRAHVRR